MPPSVRHWSASSARADDECRRKGYYHSHYQSKGLERRTAFQSLPFAFGQGYHQGIAALTHARQSGATHAEALTAGITSAHPCLTLDDPVIMKEAQWVLEGLLTAWAHVILPQEERLFNTPAAYVEYKGWSAADENLVAIVDFAAPVTAAGAEVYGLNEGDWVYKERKTTSTDLTGSRATEWHDQWTRDPQLLTGPRTLQAAHGITIGGSIVEGAFKGYRVWDEEAQSRAWRSPFLEGWSRGTDLHGMPIEWAWKRPKNYRGWEPQNPLRLTVSARAFVETYLVPLAPTLLRGLFTQTPLIVFDDIMAEEWLAQKRIRQQRTLALTHNPTIETLRSEAPMNLHACVGWGGEHCPFYDLCWNTPASVSPLDIGFVLREDPWAELLITNEG